MRESKTFRATCPAAFAILSAAIIFTACCGQRGITVNAPEQGAVVPTQRDGQKAFLNLSREERRARFADENYRKEMQAVGFWQRPVTLSWSAKGCSGDGDDSYVVSLYIDGKETPVLVTNIVATAKGGSVDVDNLEIARDYRWTVADATGAEAEGRFTTEDAAPRFMRAGKLDNFRDLGGRVGLNGRRVKQGMVYRNTAFNYNATATYYTVDEALEIPEERAKVADLLDEAGRWRELAEGTGELAKVAPAVLTAITNRVNEKLSKVVKERIPSGRRLDDATMDYLRNDLGIKSDIDLRSDGECYGMDGCPLGPSVTWFHYSSACYGGMKDDWGKEAFKQVFRVFLDEKNYPIDFHCIAGQDRTGAVAFIINGLLGVDEEELYRDWEATGFWNPNTRFNHERLFDHLVKVFDAYPGDTINQRIEAYVLALGFTMADIEKLRSIMLE